MLIESIENEE